MNCLRGTQTINWLGGLPEQQDFEFTDLGPRGLVVDKLDGHDLRRGVCDLGGFENGQFYFDEAHHYAASYKITHTESYDVWPAYKRHGGETPRGTKPSYIGGKKKTKQQRAVTKARRKQR